MLICAHKRLSSYGSTTKRRRNALMLHYAAKIMQVYFHPIFIYLFFCSQWQEQALMGLYFYRPPPTDVATAIKLTDILRLLIKYLKRIFLIIKRSVAWTQQYYKTFQTDGNIFQHGYYHFFGCCIYSLS